MGDSVAEDQTLCDVMTDKAAVEVPSPVAGRVVELGGEVGQVMAVGSVLIRIETAARRPRKRGAGAAAASRCRAASLGASRGTAAVARRAAPPPPAATHRRRRPHATTAAGGGSATPRHRLRPRRVRSPRRPCASAPALCGIDLSRLNGSGPDGRIVHADLDAARSTGARATRAAAAPTDGTREVKLIGLRRAIAQKMQQSKRSIPHFTYVEEVDVTEMVALRDELNRQYAVQRGELSPLAFVIRAIVRAVADFPQVNARFDDEAGVLTLYDAVHLGVATQTDGGLMVPVLRQAQTLDLWDCSPGHRASWPPRRAPARRRATNSRARRSPSPASASSAASSSTPVINHPEVAIVGINRIVARPMVRDGTVQVRQMMNLSSSFDHRVVDGSVAAAYIQRVRQLLEHPATLFID